jgi:cobalt-zinc-cadmium efflux system protein
MHDKSNRREATAGRPLKITLVIVLVVLVAEVVGGVLSNSLALISDAGHMLTDALALGLSLFAFSLARRPATPTRTYGYHRAEIMAALANGAILVLVSAYIFYEAYQRFFVTPVIETPLMLVTAGVGLAANLAGMLVLRSSRRGSLNIKAAFWHIIGDTLSSVGVIIAGIIILITGWYIVDPIVAIVIGCVILWGAFRIVREATDILLESVPGHVRIQEVTDTIKDIPGVKDIHDVHIWTITSGIYALSAHLNIEDQMVSESNNIVTRVNDLLAGDYNITHTTLQLECDSCPTGLVCNLP